MKPIELRFYTDNRGPLILTGLIFGLVIGLILTRPKQAAYAIHLSTITLEPLVTTTASHTPTLPHTVQPTASATETPTQTPSPSPTDTPTQTASPTPTFTVTPHPTYLVWAPDFAGGNIRETPNGRILFQLENGSVVEWLSQIEEDAGHTWLWVMICYQNGCTNGWMAESLLYPLPFGDLARVNVEDGAYLRADPQGNVLTWLGAGAPVVLLAESIQSGDYVWAKVRTLDEIEGWMAETLLTPFEP
jgi:hypothetical protein